MQSFTGTHATLRVRLQRATSAELQHTCMDIVTLAVFAYTQNFRERKTDSPKYGLESPGTTMVTWQI